MSIENNRRHIFISHHHADDAEVSNLTALLTKNGHDIRNSSDTGKTCKRNAIGSGARKGGDYPPLASHENLMGGNGGGFDRQGYVHQAMGKLGS